MDEVRYGASSGVVIHSGIFHPVTAIMVRLDINDEVNNVPDVTIDYSVIAEGIRPIEGKIVIDGTELHAMIAKGHDIAQTHEE